MAVDGLTFHHQRDVAELRLVQDAEEISRICGREHIVESLSVQCLAKIELADSCGLHLVLLLNAARLRRGNSVAFIVRHLGWVGLEHTAHVLVSIIHPRPSPHAWIGHNHAVDCLRGVHLLVSGLPLLLVGLALLTIAVFVEARSATYPTASQTLLFFFQHSHFTLVLLNVEQCRVLLCLRLLV